MKRAKTVRYMIEVIILAGVILYYWTYWRPRTPVDYSGSWMGTPGPGGREARSLLWVSESRRMIAGISPEQGQSSISLYDPSGLNWSAPDSGAPKNHLVIEVFERAGVIYGLYFANRSDSGGILVSKDGGMNWLPSTPIPGDADPRCIDTGPDGTMYLGTVASGVFTASGSELNWTGRNTGLTNQRIQSIAADPFLSGCVLAGTLQGLFRLTGAESHWEKTMRGLPSNVSMCIFLTANHHRKGDFYAIVKDDKGAAYVVRSGNHGKSWRSIMRGLPPGVQPRVVAVDPEHPKTLYLGTVYDGVYRSDDNGLFWSEMNRNLPVKTNNIIVHDLLKHPDTPLYAATDLNGAVWEYKR